MITPEQANQLSGIAFHYYIFLLYLSTILIVLESILNKSNSTFFGLKMWYPPVKIMFDSLLIFWF